MDRLAEDWFRHRAELKLLKLHSIAYQDHFNDLMEAVHGSDFIRVRPAGRAGDRKCDGYLRRTDTVFQVYAPHTVRINEWLAKIDEDFNGALNQWAQMRAWTFVHNQHDGLPPDVAQAILKVEDGNPTLTIDQWAPSRLLDLSERLSEERLVRLFGNPPREEDMRTLDRGDVANAVAGLSGAIANWTPGSDLPLIDPRKMDYNELSDRPRRFLTAGIAQSSLVDGYFNNHTDPNLRDRVGAMMKGEWNRLRSATTPDGAFDELFEHVAAHAAGSREVTASLALLAYLFEECDIFDNPPPDWAGRPS